MSRAKALLEKLGTPRAQRMLGLLTKHWTYLLGLATKGIERRAAEAAAAQGPDAGQKVREALIERGAPPDRIVVGVVGDAPAESKAAAAKAARVRLGDLLLEEALRPAPGRARDLAAQIEQAIFISGATAAEVAALRASAERAATSDDEASGPDPRDPVMDALVELYLRQGGVHVSAGAAAV